MKVFVTGHRGFIGAHLVALLKQGGHHVTGCDLNLFEGCNWEPLVEADCELVKDVRDVTEADLDGHDCVMHLAAISNDPMGKLAPQLTTSINRDGSVHLAEVAKHVGVDRMLFSSSCSIYGKGAKMDLAEDDPLCPLTTYAASKIDTERALAQLADANFVPVFLRNATAYGHSPMLRIDLVVNNMLACAVACGEIRIMSDGSPWRPLTHARDIARAFIACMNAERSIVAGQAINIGDNSQNFQVKDVAQRVGDIMPQAKIVFTGEIGVDPRNYRVCFDKLNNLLPDFHLEYNLFTGMEELYRKYREHHFSLDDFQGPRFVRLRTLKDRLDRIAQPAATGERL